MIELDREEAPFLIKIIGYEDELLICFDYYDLSFFEIGDAEEPSTVIWFKNGGETFCNIGIEMFTQQLEQQIGEI